MPSPFLRMALEGAGERFRPADPAKPPVMRRSRLHPAYGSVSSTVTTCMRAIRPAVIALLLTVVRLAGAQGGATGGSPAGAPRDTSLRLHRHAATERGYDANAWWIESRSGLVLIDALLTRSDARALVAAMQSTGKPLAGVFLTHPHADHFGGLATVHEAFPRAPIFATRATITGVRREHDKGIKDGWLAALGTDYEPEPRLPDRVVASGDTIVLAGVTFVVRDYGAVEAENNSVIHVPALRALFTGDATVSGASVYAGEGHALEALEALPRLLADHPTVEQAYSGHYGAQNLRVIVEDNIAQLQHHVAAAALVLSDTAARDGDGRLLPRARARLGRALAMHAQPRHDYGVGAAGVASLNANGLLLALPPSSGGTHAHEATVASRRGVRRLLFLLGRWSGADFRLGLGGLYVDGTAVTADHRYEFVLSYDHVQDRYRMTSRDQRSGLLDVYDGAFDAGGRLVLTNVASGTHFRTPSGVAVHTRLTFTMTDDNRWTLTAENREGERPWTRVAEYVMTRQRIE